MYAFLVSCIHDTSLPIFVPEDVAKAKALCNISQLVIFVARSYRLVFPDILKVLHSCDKLANTNLMSDRVSRS